MQKLKLNVLIAFLSYGGNGNVGMQLPSITTWFAKRYLEMKNDPRIDQIACKQYGDIPLSMERNRIVKDAKENGYDVILMLDSDNVPDLYDGHLATAKPFWETSFDFLYNRAVKGLPTVICAPYCGPPPHPTGGGQENVYVFYAEGMENQEAGAPRPSIKFSAYSREHASMMRGIQPIAAGPTGVILYTTDSFDLMPKRIDPMEILEQYKSGKLDIIRAKQLLEIESWFYYEYEDAERTRKASTEDVTSTREIQFAGIEKHGEPIVFCNWDSWAGHYKPKCVGAPNPLKIESVSKVFAEAVRNNMSVYDSCIELDLPEIQDDLVVNLPVEQEGTAPSQLPLKNIIHTSVKTMRFTDKVFKNPSLSLGECETLASVVEYVQTKQNNNLCVVVGDSSGETTYAAKSQCKDLDVFVSLPSAQAVEELKAMKLKIKTMLNADPLTLDKSNAALVIVQARGREADACADVIAWAQHLQDGGAMLVVGLDEKAAEHGDLTIDEFVQAIGVLEAVRFDGVLLIYKEDIPQSSTQNVNVAV